MKVFVQVILLSILFGFCSVMAIADDQTPAEEDVCAELQLPGVTPGLYGLCNAYCEAQDCDEYGPVADQPRSCQRLFHNFVNKASGPDDPPEPLCLQETGPQVPPCACWPIDSGNNGIPDALEPPLLPVGDGWDGSCIFDESTGFYGAGFVDNDAVALFILDEFSLACQYELSGQPLVTMTPLSGAQFDDCKQGIAYLRDVYFPATCTVIPPPE